MEQNIIDGVRVLSLVMGAATVAVAVVVVLLYGRLYNRARHMQPKSKWRGLLPRHVFLIGVSYILVLVASMGDIVGFIGDPVTWRVPTFAVAYACGLWAMWDVLGHSRLRLNSLNPPDPTVPSGEYTDLS